MKMLVVNCLSSMDFYKKVGADFRDLITFR